MVKVSVYLYTFLIADSGDRVAKLIEYYGEGKVFGVEYNSSPRSTGQIVPSWQENAHKVKVDKLMQNKKYITWLKEGYVRHPQIPNNKLLQLYSQHWQNVFIRDEEDDRTGAFYQVIGRKSDDHFSQASVYAMLGLERVRELAFGSGKYGFNADFVEMQGVNEPTPPDIFSQY